MINKVQGNELYHWPEFKALCKRLGVPWEFFTTDMRIDIPCEGLVAVTQTFCVVDQTSSLVDTTDVHNREFRTHQPSKGFSPTITEKIK